MSADTVNAGSGTPDTDTPDTETIARIESVAREVAAQGASSPRSARDPVNMAAIRNWTDAIGDTSPLYTDAAFAAGTAHGQLVAPPAMVQVWTMPGLQPAALAGTAGPDPLGQMMAVLDEAGYTSVVATNCEQTYQRYLRHGELLSLRSELAGVSGPKRTGLGEGWFVTTRNTWYSGDEIVATMNWRVLKFKPPSGGTGGRPPGSAQPADPRLAAGKYNRISLRGLPRRLIRLRCDRRTRPIPSSSGPGPGAVSCASSAAGRAARCVIHPAPRACPAASARSRSIRSRPEPAPSTAMSCTGTRRCRASSCRS